MHKHFPEELIPELQQGITTLGISMSPPPLNHMVEFINLLLKWNKAFNLTAISDPREIIYRHILDSLSIAPYLNKEKILDVGTGAGFPGLPLAIVFPNLKFTLLDSNGKKIRFLTQVISQLQLRNVAIVQERVEKFSPPTCFDTVVCRAFAQISDSLAKTKHLVCEDGKILLMKGAYPQTELEKIKDHVKVYTLHVPGLKEQRHLVCIEGCSM